MKFSEYNKILRKKIGRIKGLIIFEDRLFSIFRQMLMLIGYYDFNSDEADLRKEIGAYFIESDPAYRNAPQILASIFLLAIQFHPRNFVKLIEHDYSFFQIFLHYYFGVLPLHAFKTYSLLLKSVQPKEKKRISRHFQTALAFYRNFRGNPDSLDLYFDDPPEDEPCIILDELNTDLLNEIESNKTAARIIEERIDCHPLIINRPSPFIRRP